MFIIIKQSDFEDYFPFCYYIKNKTTGFKVSIKSISGDRLCDLYVYFLDFHIIIVQEFIAINNTV